MAQALPTNQDLAQVTRKADYEGGLKIGDFLLVQDNWGGPLHQVEIHGLHMLQPAIVTSLQGLLGDFPEWRLLSVSTFRVKNRLGPEWA